MFNRDCTVEQRYHQHNQTIWRAEKERGKNSARVMEYREMQDQTFPKEGMQQNMNVEEDFLSSTNVEYVQQSQESFVLHLHAFFLHLHTFSTLLNYPFWKDRFLLIKVNMKILFRNKLFWNKSSRKSKFGLWNELFWNTNFVFRITVPKVNTDKAISESYEITFKLSHFGKEFEHSTSSKMLNSEIVIGFRNSFLDWAFSKRNQM